MSTTHLPRLLSTLERAALGAVARVYPPELVDKALDTWGRKEERRRALPPRLMVYFVIAMALFSSVSYREVLQNLVESLRGVRAYFGQIGRPRPSLPRRCPLPCVPRAPAPAGHAEMGGRRRPKQGAGMARRAVCALGLITGKYRRGPASPWRGNGSVSSRCASCSRWWCSP